MVKSTSRNEIIISRLSPALLIKRNLTYSGTTELIDIKSIIKIHEFRVFTGF